MARPKKPATEQRTQVNVRLLPKHLMAIVDLAAHSERPLATEAEQLIVEALEARERGTPQTRELLRTIETRIADLQLATKGKWHKNLETWSAVSQMLQFIIDDMRPERPLKDDEFVEEAWQAKCTADARRRSIVGELALLGVAVTTDPATSGISLGARFNRGLFGSTVQKTSPREWEQKAIDALPDEIRERASDLFSRLQFADAEADEATARYNEKMKPYWEAEESGRKKAIEMFDAQPEWNRTLKALESSPLLRGAPRLSSGKATGILHNQQIEGQS